VKHALLNILIVVSAYILKKMDIALITLNKTSYILEDMKSFYSAAAKSLLSPSLIHQGI